MEEISEEKKLKKELDTFNFGAFGLTWIWGIFNGSFKETCPAIILCIISRIFPYWSTLISLILICFAIYCGTYGNKWAYNNKKWDSLEKFNKIQKNWAIATVIVFIATIAGIAIFTTFFVKSFVKNPERAFNQVVVYALAQEKGFTDGNDIAKKLIESKSLDSSSGNTKTKLYNSNSIILTSSTGNQNVISFYKNGKCSLSKRNCYIMYYNVEKDNLIHKSTTYYDEFGKSKYEVIK